MKQISDKTWLLLILLAGLARGGLLWQRYDNLAKDPDGYRAIAQFVAVGSGYVHPKTNAPTAYRPPTYTILLAMIDALGLGQAGVAVVHLLLGTSTIYLTWSIGSRLGLARLSLLAAGLIAIDPILLQQTTLVMSETLATFLVALLFRVATPDLRHLESEMFSRSRLFTVGIIFGVAALCRPTMWAFGALVTVWWFWKHCQWKQWLQAAPVVAGVLLIVSPWGVRNTIVFGTPILTTTHGGYTLLLGNNPVYYDEVVSGKWGAVWSGDSLQRWQKHLETEIEKADPRITTEVERDRWMYSRARHNIAEQALLFFQACLLRLGRGLWGVLPLTGSDTNFAAVLRGSVALFYVTVFCGMLLGMFSLKKENRAAWIPLLLLIAAFTLVHTCYWANLRMRAPLMPVIALLFAQGCLALKQRRQASLKTGKSNSRLA